jgi:hypothetical protein
VPTVIAAVAMALCPGVAQPAAARVPAGSSDVGQPAMETGALIPPRLHVGPSYIELRSASPGYVSYRYGPADGPGQELTVYSLADGSAVRPIPNSESSTVFEPFLSGSSVIQPLEGDGTYRPGKVVVSDVASGEVNATIDIPVSDRYVAASSAGVVTTRDDAGTRQLHLLRADGTDVTVAGPAPGDSSGVLRGGDERTFVYYASGELWALDLASAVTTRLAEEVELYVRAVLTPNRIYWIERLETQVRWAPRPGVRDSGDPQPRGQVSVDTGGRVQNYLAFGDDLVGVRPHDLVSGVQQFELLRLDLTTGDVGPALVRQVVAARATGDGSLGLVLADGESGRLATLAPGDLQPRAVADLPRVQLNPQWVHLSGDRVAAGFLGATYQPGGEQSIHRLGSAEWQPGLGDGPLAGTLLQLSGDVALTQQAEWPRSSAEHRLLWNGGSRVIFSDSVALGRGGRLVSVRRGNTVEVQDVRSGALRRSFSPQNTFSMDGSWVRWWADGRLVSVDTTRPDAEHEVALPCDTLGWQGSMAVVDRWALVVCARGVPWVVDLEGTMPPWQVPYEAGSIQLGNGFIAVAEPRADAQDGTHAVTVTDLGPGHAQRAYGPLQAYGPTPWSPVAIDEEGGPRLVHLGPRGTMRRVDLDWLTAAPARDTVAPVVRSTGGTPGLAPTTTVTFAWDVRDVAGAGQAVSGLAEAQVRYRQRGAQSSRFGAWVYPPWLEGSRTSMQISAPRGTEVCWQVRGHDKAGNLGAFSAERCTKVDGSAPIMTTADAGLAVVAATKASTVRFTYAARDNVAVSSYDVRYRLAAPGQALGTWTMPSAWQRTKATRRSLKAQPGAQLCWSARARDGAGGVSAWSTPRCAAVPYDDRSLAAKGSVRRASDGEALGRTVTVLRAPGATVSRSGLRGRRVALVALHEPKQGRVDVLVNGARVKRLSLAAAKSRRVVTVLPERAFKGTVTVRSVDKAPVRIDALAVLRQ